MAAAFAMSWWHYLMLGVSLLRSVLHCPWHALPKRLLLFVPGWLVFGVLNALHWVGFLIDELVFPAYRSVRIHRPVSIVGVPRSGTTFLHRVLSREPGFTTLTLFECVVAPSISERYLWFGLARLFRPLARVRWPFRSRFLASMRSIHEFGFSEPEEDFLLLLWVGACFLLVVPCPGESRYWHLARFDEDVPRPQQQAVFKFYRRCLQRHLYFHGDGLCLLSKNPSFTPMLNSLREEFPEVVLVACVREPQATVPSQLSSLLPAFALLADGQLPPGFQDKMIETLHHYYQIIGALSRQGKLPTVSMARLNQELPDVVGDVIARAGIAASPDFQATLADLAQSGQDYRSGHKYAAADFGLDDKYIGRFFSDVWPLS